MPVPDSEKITLEEKINAKGGINKGSEMDDSDRDREGKNEMGYYRWKKSNLISQNCTNLRMGGSYAEAHTCQLCHLLFQPDNKLMKER